MLYMRERKDPYLLVQLDPHKCSAPLVGVRSAQMLSKVHIMLIIDCSYYPYLVYISIYNIVYIALEMSR